MTKDLEKRLKVIRDHPSRTDSESEELRTEIKRLKEENSNLKGSAPNCEEYAKINITAIFKDTGEPAANADANIRKEDEPTDFVFQRGEEELRYKKGANIYCPMNKEGKYSICLPKGHYFVYIWGYKGTDVLGTIFNVGHQKKSYYAETRFQLFSGKEKEIKMELCESKWYK